jgi:hypothetical protein
MMRGATAPQHDSAAGFRVAVSWWLALRNLAPKILGVENRCVGNLDKSSAAYVDSHATFQSAAPGPASCCCDIHRLHNSRLKP